MTTQFNHFKNNGYIQHKFTDYELLPIKKEIEKIKNNNFNGTKWNHNLAGNIEKEFKLNDSHDYLEKLMTPFCFNYDAEYNYTKNVHILNKDVPIYLDSSWVNFQKKGEFNPVHNHSGIYSFVIWIDIPYLIEDEKEVLSNINPTVNCPGYFTFYYTNSLGKICGCEFPADKTWNNTMLFFPSELSHSVYPFFTSDDYRISVSGNFKLFV